ncbi:MAG: glucose-1-phosphate thymidylyltransferase [Candidatus Neomarinimicrobiota bacterium]
MKALITAGGHGTRLRPITHTQNKHLIPIANKLMLDYALEYVAEAGIREAGIVINAGDTSIRDAFGNGDKYGLNLTYIPQSAPLGLAHVVKIAQDFIGDEPFIFYLGDNILVGGVQSYIESFKSNHSNCHLVLSRVQDPNRFGVAELSGDRIIGIEEKPQAPKSDLAVTGIYIYDKSIFEAVNNIQPSARGELEISDAHQYLLDHGKAVSYSVITGWWKDTGKPSDLLEANRLVLDNIQPRQLGRVDATSELSGAVSIGRNTRVINSRVRGPVIIGENVELKDAYIGPYTAIGDGCKIINSEIEFTIMLENCTVKEVKGRIDSSLIGTDVEIIQAERKPHSHRFILGDQSRVVLH